MRNYKIFMLDGSFRLMTVTSEEFSVEGEIAKWLDADQVQSYEPYIEEG